MEFWKSFAENLIQREVCYVVNWIIRRSKAYKKMIETKEERPHTFNLIAEEMMNYSFKRNYWRSVVKYLEFIRDCAIEAARGLLAIVLLPLSILLFPVVLIYRLYKEIVNMWYVYVYKKCFSEADEHA